MAIVAWPSLQIPGNHEGQGNKIHEPAWQKLVSQIHGGRAGAAIGFALSDNGGLTVRIALGTACINGYWVVTDFNVDVEAIDNADSYQYLKLKRNSLGAVVDPGVEGVSSIELIRHPDYMLVARTRASEGDIIFVNHAIEYAPGFLSGSYIGNGAVNRTVYIYPLLSNLIPTLVMIHSTSSTDNLYALSAIESPYNRRSYNEETPQARVVFKSEVSEIDIAKVLRGSASWDISISSLPYYDSKTVSVPGATTADHVIVNYSDPEAYEHLFFGGYVSASGVVTVYATSAASDSRSYTGTVNVLVVQKITEEFGGAVFLSDATSDLAPLITFNGFKVSDNDSEAITLNKNGVQYNYLAMI